MNEFPRVAARIRETGEVVDETDGETSGIGVAVSATISGETVGDADGLGADATEDEVGDD